MELNGDRLRAAEMVADLRVLYPRLLRQIPPLGLELGPGWYRIIDEWFREADRLLSDEQASLFHLDQVKEKLGGLRIHFYLGRDDGMPGAAGRHEPPDCAEAPDLPSERLRELTRATQERPWPTCFLCGKPGAVRETAWRRVSCGECALRLESQS